MTKDIHLVFHRRGLRSNIEVDLCADCPRNDDRGCCGFYSPVFYPTDLVYLKLNRPDLIDLIFSLPRLTILDASVTLNSEPDGAEGFHCQFHRKNGGCELIMLERESVCRHFVCLGIGWEREDALQPWKDFFDRLTDFEISLNNELAARIKARGLSLRKPEDRKEILHLLTEWTNPAFFSAIPDAVLDQTGLPEKQAFTLQRSLTFGNEWIL